MKEKIINFIDKLLIIDVFLVLVGFFWFAIAVFGDYVGINLGLATWQKLWIPLFNPAIGILFLGAFLSWGIKKVSQLLISK
jgi:hypothetical protein